MESVATRKRDAGGGSDLDTAPLLPESQIGSRGGRSTLLVAADFVIKFFVWLTYSQTSLLIKKGFSGQLDKDSARSTHPRGTHPAILRPKFEEVYSDILIKGTESKRSFLVLRTLASQHRWLFIQQAAWTIPYILTRMSAPFFLRELLSWMINYKDGESGVSEGWLWGVLFSLAGVITQMSEERILWLGSVLAYRATVSISSAAHSKSMRLNSSSMLKMSKGHVLNLVSNDLMRFEFTLTTLPFIVYGPIEAVVVTVLVARVLGIVPAIAGTSSLLLLVVFQCILTNKVGDIRNKTAIATDKRIGRIGEILSGILSVKMLGWENTLLKKVNKLRMTEHKWVERIGSIRGEMMTNIFSIIHVVHSVMFITYRFTGGDFNVPDIMLAMALVSMLEVSIGYLFIFSIQTLSELVTTEKRLDSLFVMQETAGSSQIASSNPSGHIEIKHGNFGWEKYDGSVKQTLSGINLSIQPGELIGITGEVGSGKSSLLQCIMGEMLTTSSSATIDLSGSVAYSAQSPWICPVTVRENILFGRELDNDLYDRVIDSCALTADIRGWNNGDLEKMAVRGANISGGQKARISFARAAYSQSDINLLDDPLSAVDPHVANKLFEKFSEFVVLAERNCTRVGASLQFLPRCDRIVVMKEGRIEAVGTWDKLAKGGILRLANRSTIVSSKTDQFVDKSKRTSHEGGVKSSVGEPGDPDAINSSIEEESAQTGRISAKTCWRYVLYMGPVSFLLVIGSIIFGVAILFGVDWIIAKWSSADSEKELRWVWLLISFTGGGLLVSLIANVFFFVLTTRTSSDMHEDMLRCVLAAPLRFFHANPTGRILNRFSKDIGLQDERLPLLFEEVLLCIVMLILAGLIMAMTSPYIAIVLAVVMWVILRTRSRFMKVSTDIKRFSAICRSPVYEMLEQDLEGLSTIRPYGKENFFQARFDELVHLEGTWSMAFFSLQAWFVFRVDAVVVALLVCFTMISVALSKQLPEEMVGLALHYLFRFVGLVSWIARQSAEMEGIMTVIERNLEYTALDPEPQKELSERLAVPYGWPYEGAIEYKGLTASYRPGIDPVLKDISFKIPGGSYVGIVGATGSGKSSLLLTLYRLINIEQGSIVIDGIDTSDIGLSDLRRQLAVIPQDPVIFEGTLRDNLDPSNELSDALLWNALKNVCMDKKASEIGGLSAHVSESDLSLSSVLRVLLTDAKIVALDEATANIDKEIDALIQKTLRTVIVDRKRTLLTIAHRIDTIMDSDQILVLRDGRVAEFGSPRDLLSRKNGLFAGMVGASRRMSK